MRVLALAARQPGILGRQDLWPPIALAERQRNHNPDAGWAKTVAAMRKARHRGLPKVDWQFTLAMAAYNLVRLPKLLVVAK